MKKLFSFLGVALLATAFFSACKPDEPKGGGDDNGTTTTTETGVINGVKWATRNIDAFGTFAAAPESIGMFYQWNRPKAWAATGNITGWYNTTPIGTTWESSNNPCPAGWRVPTLAELQSLLDTDKVTSEWTTENGINGRRFTDKTTNKSIFLPAAGFRGSYGGALYDAGSGGYYWSSTESNSDGAYRLTFNSGSAGLSYSNKAHGFSVRCVAE